jgi:tape measure domain-containing protein
MARSVQIASVFTAIGFKVNKKDLVKLQKQLGHLKSQIRSLQSHAKLNINPNVKGLTAAKTQLSGINRELSKIKNKVIRVKVDQSGTSTGRHGNAGKSVGRGAFKGSAIGSQLGQFGAGAGVLGLTGFAGAGILKTGQQLQAVKAGLIAASGGIEEGKKQFQFMIDLSDKLGINFEDNVRSYQNFLASAKAVDFSLSDTQSVFAATAASARVLGLSSADTNGIMRAMTQILSKGTVQSEELRGQLGERLPGAVGLMSKALGVSVVQLNKMLEQGEVISKDALPKLRNQMIKFATANGALDKAVNSNLANQERLANAWFFFKANIAESGFMDIMTETFVRFIKILNGNEEAAGSVGAVFQGLARIFKMLFSVVGDLLTAIGAMPAVFQVILGFLTLLLLPFATWAIAIVAVVSLLEDMFSFMRGEESVLGEFIDKLKEMETTLNGIAVALGIISTIAGVKAIRAVSKAVKGKIPAKIVGPVKPLVGPGTSFGGAAGPKVTPTVTQTAGKLGKIIRPIAAGLAIWKIYTDLAAKLTTLSNSFSSEGQLINLKNQLAEAQEQKASRNEGFLNSLFGPNETASRANEENIERLQQEIKIHVTADPGFTPVVIN